MYSLLIRRSHEKTTFSISNALSPSFSVFWMWSLDRTMTRWTGSLTYKCSKNGVEYVQSDSGLALSVNVDGTPIKCN